MKIIMVRHGETVENRNGTVQGQIPGKLTELGIKQAKLVGERLKNHVFDIIYSSDLQRVVDTTKEIAVHHPNVEIIYDKRLREWSRGIYEGGTRDKLRKAINDSGLDFVEFKPKGGESVKEMHTRVNDFINYLKEKEQGKKVLIVTHGGFVTLSHLTFKNEDYEKRRDYHPKNTAVSEIEYLGEGKFKINILNCTNHLDESDLT